jgi:hypothetical protein
LRFAISFVAWIENDIDVAWLYGKGSRNICLRIGALNVDGVTFGLIVAASPIAFFAVVTALYICRLLSLSAELGKNFSGLRNARHIKCFPSFGVRPNRLKVHFI